ncbi:MAG TPA: recombination mediator RecR [Syntrophales bacterium]|jgi:recombination protein RecR|nr:recombination mediator RecR [Syntrophales bacterium]HOX94106.1 recombination mediator RecR [Syntrophales bacterium]HPI55955.1 recombination mediator RecR [Syntrophales bacterium]HPN24155.1 recombination mediator RecR [Syntrophales bacterium]HQM28434.1 recombination mediator RecR [Syntrophales bacterium]
MTGYALPIRRLIVELTKLPGIGEKTATRLATFILRSSEEDAKKLAESILDVKVRIRLCRNCFNLAEGELCEICRDPGREKETICIVEDPDALIAVEESGVFNGKYHVLHGALSPLDGVGPEQLRLKEFMGRISSDGVREVIVATNPSVQGESTALLITKLLRERGITVTRIALGIPVGGDLKYTDRMTLAKAMEFRRNMEETGKKQKP